MISPLHPHWLVTEEERVHVPPPSLPAPRVAETTLPPPPARPHLAAAVVGAIVLLLSSLLVVADVGRFRAELFDTPVAVSVQITPEGFVPPEVTVPPTQEILVTSTLATPVRLETPVKNAEGAPIFRTAEIAPQGKLGVRIPPEFIGKTLTLVATGLPDHILTILVQGVVVPLAQEPPPAPAPPPAAALAPPPTQTAPTPEVTFALRESAAPPSPITLPPPTESLRTNRFAVGSPLIPQQVYDPAAAPPSPPSGPKLVEFHRAAENPQTGPLLWGIVLLGMAATAFLCRRGMQRRASADGATIPG